MEKQVIVDKHFNPYDLNDVAHVDHVINSRINKNGCQTSLKNSSGKKPKLGFLHQETEPKK